MYEDEGFTFDAGPTVITAPDCLEELFEVAGRDSPTTSTCCRSARSIGSSGKTATSSTTRRLRAQLRQIRGKSPEDVEGYEAFLRYSEEVFDQGYTRLAHVPFLDWWSMVRVAPQLVHLQAYRSRLFDGFRFIREPHLRQAFSFHSLLVGGNPFTASSIYTLIHFLERSGGVWFPLGGTGALVDALVRLFRELGGRCAWAPRSRTS